MRSAAEISTRSSLTWRPNSNSSHRDASSMRGVYRGPAGFAEVWEAFQAAWDDIEVRVERMEDVEDRVLTLGHFHGHGSGSGAEITAEAAWLHTLKDGSIVHLRSFSSWQEALEAAGQSPGA